MPKWTCSVTIVNETDQTLHLISSELPWGKKDGIFPERIGPGESGKFSVYTPNAISSGIEMTFTMRAEACGMSSKIDPLFRLNLTHPNVFRVWVSFFIISDFHTVI